MYNGSGYNYKDGPAGGGQMVNYSYGSNTAGNVTQVPATFCYQVDFNAIATGKVIAMSKRRIRW
jgi:hypothetical protein